ncbi:hypothetical protein K280104A7_03980 [Candidatus Bariatricus faecipullorum]
MIKIFLVEDEVVIRNGIKHSIQWEREGYEFVGEASDGELAYPLILKEKPDILITDIKMPFMDGLELSEAVKKEMPDIKILILSGYNDFDYAKKAIGIGVTDYILKPVSAEKLLEAIGNVAVIIRKEREEKGLLAKYQEEMQENREQEKLNFFNRLLMEPMTVTEILEQGKELGMELNARVYNMILFTITSSLAEKETHSIFVTAFERVEAFFESRSFLYYFRRGVEGWGILVLAESEEEMEQHMELCQRSLGSIMLEYPELQYFGGIGKPVSRIREIQESFREAERAFAGRFVYHDNQIVSQAELEEEREEELEISGVGSLEHNREALERFLKTGTTEELDSFLKAYFDSIPQDNLRSLMMGQYILMDCFISILNYGKEMGIAQEELKERIGDVRDIKNHLRTPEEMKQYLENLMREVLVLRDEISGRRYSDIIRQAKEYIENNYMSEDISLNSVSASVSMSPSYFSSIFSQEAGQTFVEYLTGVRMQKAKELLMSSSRRTSEIGFEVGYKDSHYFSYIFKKTQGCSPREYRMRGKE